MSNKNIQVGEEKEPKLAGRACDSLGDIETSSKYTYSPLLEKGSTRLLRLMPHKDKKAPIQCQLFEYPLQELDEGTQLYEALSYAWGSKQDPQSVYIQSVDKSDNHHLFVTANLHAALSHLRDRYIERIIWIDAICINQDHDIEKGEQVQSMAKIYAKASRVVVWLGEASDNSDQALDLVRETARGQSANTATNKTNEHMMVTLLKRPWFQRIWVLQEVAAARQILIKCGSMEIDGYVFCSGLNTLKLSYEACPELRGLISSVIYLIRDAIFRPRNAISRAGRFSLDIRPLNELMEMYHTRKATERHDKVYALLGMSSDDPSVVGLWPNYEAPWKEVFRKLVKFSVPDQMVVNTWDDKDIAVIKGKAYVLGKISSATRDETRDDRQTLGITWIAAPRNFRTGSRTIFDMTWQEKVETIQERRSYFTFPISAKIIDAGDAVCLLQGASRPTIFRPCNGFSTIIRIAASFPDDPEPTAIKWQDFIPPITSFPNDMLLVWDLGASQSKSQECEDYERLIKNRETPRCPSTQCKCQDHLDESIKLLDFGLLLNTMERYEDAGHFFRKAVEAYKTALKIREKTCQLRSPRRDGQRLRVITDLVDRLDDVTMETSYEEHGQGPLSFAAAWGTETVVRLLLDSGANVDAGGELGYETPLSRAAAKGHKTIVQMLLDKGASVDAYANSGVRTPLSWAARNGHEAVVRLLLDKGADINSRDMRHYTPLSWAAENGHEAVVRLLLDKGADIEKQDTLLGYTPLHWAVANGHEPVVRLLLENGAAIDTEDLGGETLLQCAIRKRYGDIVRLLKSHTVKPS